MLDEALVRRSRVAAPSGFTLVELIVAFALASLVLAVASGSLLRQQRAARWVGGVDAGEGQMRVMSALLPAELALLDPVAGDIAAGEATDSTIEIRAVVASSFTCDSATTAATLIPDGLPGTPIGGTGRSPVTGDSLWYYVSDSLGWQARRILSAARVGTSCALPPSTAGMSQRLTLDAPIDVGGATPVRITRRERYVIYRASDGRWYLGLRDWSAAVGAFSAPQPVAGPFLRALASGARTGFRFFDSAGAVLLPNGSNEQRIARVRIASLVSLPAFAAADSVRRDSIDVALARSGAP